MDAESCDASTPITHRPSTSPNKSVENGHEDSARVQRFWRVGAYYGKEQYKNTKAALQTPAVALQQTSKRDMNQRSLFITFGNAVLCLQEDCRPRSQ